MVFCAPGGEPVPVTGIGASGFGRDRPLEAGERGCVQAPIRAGWSCRGGGARHRVLSHGKRYYRESGSPVVPQGYLERLTPHRWRRCLSVIAGGEGEVEKVVAESPDVSRGVARVLRCRRW